MRQEIDRLVGQSIVVSQEVEIPIETGVSSKKQKYDDIQRELYSKFDRGPSDLPVSGFMS